MSVGAPLPSAPRFMPAHWPVVAPGLLMGYVGPVFVIRIGSPLPAASFATYLKEWEVGVDARPPGVSVWAMYDIPVWPGMNAVQRRQWASMLQSRTEILRKTTRQVVLASPQAITRGAARAIFWFAPPPYPYAIVDTPQAAFARIEASGGGAAETALDRYAVLLKRHGLAATG